MTKNARVVLQDCKFAVVKHTNDLVGEDFRISWISVVTLLRAIGHVLEKVDAKQSPAMKQAVYQKWGELQQSKPEPYIFWDFIEEERNRLLKNYEHGITRRMTLPSLQHGIRLSVDMANTRGGTCWAPNAEIESYISSGRFEGMSEQKIAWIAYEWWETYLDEIDSLAQHHEKSSKP